MENQEQSFEVQEVALSSVNTSAMDLSTSVNFKTIFDKKNERKKVEVSTYYSLSDKLKVGDKLQIIIYDNTQDFTDSQTGEVSKRIDFITEDKSLHYTIASSFRALFGRIIDLPFAAEITYLGKKKTKNGNFVDDIEAHIIQAK